MIDALLQCALTVWDKSEVVASCHGIQPLSMGLSLHSFLSPPPFFFAFALTHQAPANKQLK